MLDKIKGFHIEPTNMCTLKCPRCPRTNFVEQFKPKNWDNQNLNLDHLKQFLDIDLTGMSIGLNGNYGDPIYYPNLFELIAYFKNKKCKIFQGCRSISLVTIVLKNALILLFSSNLKGM